MLTFHFSPGTSSMAPHIGLHEVGVPFESRPISLAKKENRTPAYLAINPEGHVPTLLIDGRPLSEVAGILFYLARRFPDAHLLPDDVEAQAQVVSWMSFIASTVHPARRQGLDHARAVYTIADQRLGNREWAVGKLLDRRYPPVPPVLALQQFAQARARRVLQPLRALRPHDGARGGQATLEIEGAIGYELRP